MFDDLIIPDFLRREASDAPTTTYRERRRKPEAWARPKRPAGWPKELPVPKTVSPEALALAREISDKRKAAAKARFALLRGRA